jgi:hypothetical protein
LQIGVQHVDIEGFVIKMKVVATRKAWNSFLNLGARH